MKHLEKLHPGAAEKCRGDHIVAHVAFQKCARSDWHSTIVRDV